MNAVVEAVRSLLGLLVAGDWTGLERITSGSGLPIADVRAAVAEYGRTLVMPPVEALNDLDAVEVGTTVQQTLSIRVPLWTQEEGRSDLELNLTVSEVDDGLWSVRVDDLLVP